MKGSISIPVGRYEFVNDLTLTIRASDAGAVVSISSPDDGIRQTAVIDEHGHVIAKSGQAEGISAEAVLNAVLSTGPRHVAIPSPQPPPIARPEKRGRKARIPYRVKFVLRYTSKYRPKNHAHVLGGFWDGRAVHVLYRVVLADVACPPNQIRINGKKITFRAQIPSGDRLPEARFAEVCHLPDQAVFKIGRKAFRRMSLSELGPLLKGRTLQIGPPKSG